MQRLFLAGLSLLCVALAHALTMSPKQTREENAYALGIQAYLWGSPFLYTGGTLVCDKTSAIKEKE